MALLLHISKIGIIHVLYNRDETANIALEISETILQRAFELITVLKRQFAFYKGKLFYFFK